MKWYGYLIMAAMLISLSGIACAQVEDQYMPATNETGEAGMPSITVMDQTVEGNETIGNITVDSVVSDGPGWVAIHNSLFGEPGGIVGFAPVEDGENTNITIVIDTEVATDQLIAELHSDLGQEGTFEWPPIDVPVEIDGEIVMEAFNVTAEDFELKNLTDMAATAEQ
ncbi:MAG: hypothetical protein KO206_02470 [Methanomicrobiaceae archaeon]|uniref:DUF7282 domain-containing protein n=1 Tax=hydrocarbon metagenome TaxID=938273 RepID=A0A0W8FE10_9ZZZZ|nr:hypothetical protein [Methanomicrobiaceae archaeon]MDD5419598.1 hypothetical protein [Methanomicrobiaceae archaeon]